MFGKIGVTADEDGINYEMEGSASFLIALMSSLMIKFAKQLTKAGGTPEMWIDTLAQSAKDGLKEEKE